jgi:PncC family amidohydrolase
MNANENRELVVAKEVVQLLVARNERLILAESCTAGYLCAVLGQIPGASECLCGSFVTYRPNSKMNWLGVRQNTIDKYTTESMEVATEMAYGALVHCLEAQWSVAVVGHFGPNAPAEKDGRIYVCIAYLIDGNAHILQKLTYDLRDVGRIARQRDAVEFIISHLGRCIVEETGKDHELWTTSSDSMPEKTTCPINEPNGT